MSTLPFEGRRRAPVAVSEAQLPAGGAMGYLASLDGLRAVAVILVLIHHLLAPVWDGGWIGVHIFFALSGYLITTLLLQELASTGAINLRRFYLRRLLRLYPPLLVALVALAPLSLVFNPSVLRALSHSVIAVTYTTNLYTTFTGNFAEPWEHTWSLATEEQFYLVWPVVFLLLWKLGRNRRIVLACLLVAGAASFTGFVLTFVVGGAVFNPLWNCGALLLGCSLALSRQFWSTRAGTLGWGITGVTGLAISVLIGSVNNISAGLGAVAAAVSTVVLVAHLSTGGAINRPLSTRALVHIGKISYELYLWHYPIALAMRQFAPDDFLLRVVVVVVGAFAGAEVSHRFVSRPLTRWLKPKLSGRRHGTIHR